MENSGFRTVVIFCLTNTGDVISGTCCQERGCGHCRLSAPFPDRKKRQQQPLCSRTCRVGSRGDNAAGWCLDVELSYTISAKELVQDHGTEVQAHSRSDIDLWTKTPLGLVQAHSIEKRLGDQHHRRTKNDLAGCERIPSRASRRQDETAGGERERERIGQDWVGEHDGGRGKGNDGKEEGQIVRCFVSCRVRKELVMCLKG
jgi:hypothetical protein